MDNDTSDKRNKICSKCGKKKRITYFHTNKSMKDGYLNRCKACAKDHMDAYRKANIDKMRLRERISGKLRYRKNALIKMRMRLALTEISNLKDVRDTAGLAAKIAKEALESINDSSTLGG